MDKQLYRKKTYYHDERSFEEFVFNYVKETGVFEDAVFFIASYEQILSIYKVGSIPSSMIADINYFIQSYTTKENVEYGQSLLLSVPYRKKGTDDNDSLYVGVIVKSSISNVSEKIRCIEEFVERLQTSNNIVSNTKKRISLQEMLIESHYQIEFKELASALVSCYERFCSGHISVFNKHSERYIPFLSSFNLGRISVGEVTDYLANEKINMSESIRVNNSPIFGNQYNDHVIFTTKVQSEVVSLFLFSFLSEEEAILAENTYGLWMKDLIPLLERGHILERSVQEGQRRDHLLKVTKKFHSTMNIGAVLEEIVQAIEKVYPSFRVYLLLSQEWKVSDEILIKPLISDADEGSKTAQHAFLTGQIQKEKGTNGKSEILFVPLRGKQGVYGIMEIQTAETVDLPQDEVNFIQMLADTGGNALENAELYQQSHNLIRDLQLINETSQQLNLNLRLSDTINFMTKQIIESFEADEIGFIMFHNKGSAAILEGSSSYFMEDKLETELKPFLQIVKRDKKAIYIGDTHTHGGVRLDNYQSALLIPMIRNDEIIGMVLTLHELAYHFTFEDFKLLQSLIHHSTLAFTNSMLHEELERLVITDYLTKLYSRSHLDERIQLSMNEDQEGTFLLLDIDNFKGINDRYGHQVGDDIIIQISNIMSKSVREEDVVARWGGEELAIYLPMVSIEIGQQIAERIVKAVSVKTSPKVTVSIGVSYWSSQDKKVTLKQLFNEADEALYEAKENGKNGVVIKC